MLTIEMTTQGNGWTFRLNPESRSALQQRFKKVAIGSSIFVGTDTRRSYEDIHGPMWDQIAMLLTGLSLRQIEALGGYQIVDVRNGRVFSPRDKPDAA
jgi:hypothetical protein